MRYAEVASLDGSEFERFESVAYPDREGVSLGWANGDAALAFMVETYEHDQETSDEVFHDYTADHPGKYGGTEYVETDSHVLAWHTGLSHVALYRKIPTGTVFVVAVENGTARAATHPVLTQPEGMKLFRRMCELHEFGPEGVSLWKITVYPDGHEDTDLLELS